MAEIHEHDGMRCRACGQEERASEGYPCTNCGTFICLVCSFRGVTLCAACAARGVAGQRGGGAGEADGPSRGS
jgi:hypothetical protein